MQFVRLTGSVRLRFIVKPYGCSPDLYGYHIGYGNIIEVQFSYIKITNDANISEA